MRPRSSLALIALLLSILPGCSAIGRKMNQALPDFMRSDPGHEEKERLAVLRRGRIEVTPEQRAAQKAAFDAARAEYDAKDYEEAGELFAEFVEDFPASEYDELARYLWVDSAFLDGDYGRCFTACKSYALNHVISNRSKDVEEKAYVSGKEYIEGNMSSFFGIFSNRGRGIDILTWVVTTYPNSSRAADAQWLIARYHVEDEDWEKATPIFDRIAQDYTNSEWYPAARYYQGYCRYRRVKGDYYDPQINADARERITSYLTDFPTGEWRADAQRMVAWLESIAADRLYNVAEWHEDMGKAYSARYYYLKLAKDWPKSAAAQRAQVRIAALVDAVPDVAEEQLAAEERRLAVARGLGATSRASTTETRPTVVEPTQNAASRPTTRVGGGAP